MVAGGENQPLKTVPSGSRSASDSTGESLPNGGSGSNGTPAAQAAAASAAASPSTSYGAVSGHVRGIGAKARSAAPANGDRSGAFIEQQQEETGIEQKESPGSDGDSDAAAAAILDAMEMDPAANIHNPLLYLATDELSAFNPYDHTHAVSLQGTGDEEERLRAPPRGGGGGDTPSGFELTFRGRSPKFIRFGILLLITLLPFGAHFSKSCFSSLETYFLEDRSLHFNETKYGAVMSAISVPNLFMPFFGGLFLDAKGHKQGIILFLMIELVGHALFTLAMGGGYFWLAVAGEALHGLGSGTVMVAMRAVVSKFFLDNELTFALGVTVAGACVSKTLAKASVAPIAETRWGYMGALWYVGLWQLLSLGAGLVYVRLAKSARMRVGMELEGVDHKDLRLGSLLVALRRSTLSFWLVAVLHTLFMMVYHLFSNYSGHYLFENYNVSAVLAGYISSLMPLVVVFGAPLAGLLLDRWGRQLYVLLLANAVTILAYVLLLEERAGAVVCIVMLALCESFVPTILLSALPLTVHPSVYGAAFGMAEVMSAISTIVSNVFFGYSRDKTDSYSQGVSSLITLAYVCMAITLFLIFWDARHARSMLNRGRRGMADDSKVLG